MDTVGGVVPLAGFADSQANSDKAKQVVGAVSGVKQVENRLIVMPPTKISVGSDKRSAAQAAALFNASNKRNPVWIQFGERKMKQLKYVYALLFSLMLLSLLGCAPTPTRESTGEYFDDTVITAKAKAAILDQPTLKVTEIKVETFKGVVQLSGFVNSQTDMSRAVDVVSGVPGEICENDLRLK